jgi:hypothetical protein
MVGCSGVWVDVVVPGWRVVVYDRDMVQYGVRVNPTRSSEYTLDQYLGRWVVIMIVVVVVVVVDVVLNPLVTVLLHVPSLTSLNDRDG